MKKRMSLLTVVFAVAGMIGMALPAAAADLHTPQADTSYCTYGVYHFVNNQTGGEQTAGEIEVEFSGGTETATASKVNRNVQHFYVMGAGKLIDASTDLDGRLVLSDWECKCQCGCK